MKWMIAVQSMVIIFKSPLTNDLILGNRGDGSGVHEEGEPTVFVD